MIREDRNINEQYYRLIERHKDMIERLCMSHSSGEYHRCAEMRQSCLIRIWRRMGRLPVDATPIKERMWVYWQCRSAIHRWRRKRREIPMVPIDETIADTLAVPDGGEVRDRLEVLSEVLTPHERHAFWMMAGGYTAEEIAMELGIKRHSAEQLRYRIMQRIRQRYRKDNEKDNGYEKQE